jgi:hypothetical protein
LYTYTCIDWILYIIDCYYNIFIICCCSNNGYNLKYASEELKNNKEILLEAIKNNEWALIFISNKLENDIHFLFKAYHINNNIKKFNNNTKNIHNIENDIEYNINFIKENYQLLHKYKNKKVIEYLFDNKYFNILILNNEIINELYNNEDLINYLLENQFYHIIYNSEEMNEYLKENKKLYIMTINDIDIKNEYNIDEIKKEIQDKMKCDIIWILINKANSSDLDTLTEWQYSYYLGLK